MNQVKAGPATSPRNLNDPDGLLRLHSRFGILELPKGKKATVAFSLASGYENVISVFELTDGTAAEVMRYGTFKHHVRNTDQTLAGDKTYLFAPWFKPAYGGGAHVSWQPAVDIQVAKIEPDQVYRFGGEDGADRDFDDVVATVTIES
jgi:hypothetical protein